MTDEEFRARIPAGAYGKELRGQTRKAIEEILDGDMGKIILIAGPEGSGKTTLLNIAAEITGTTKPIYDWEHPTDDELKKDRLWRLTEVPHCLMDNIDRLGTREVEGYEKTEIMQDLDFLLLDLFNWARMERIAVRVICAGDPEKNPGIFKDSYFLNSRMTTRFDLEPREKKAPSPVN